MRRQMVTTMYNNYIYSARSTNAMVPGNRAYSFMAGFHMIAEDRRRSADDRKESCFHIIANDRRADCCHAFRSKLHAPCAGGKIPANNMADVEEGICCKQIYFFFKLHRQLQNCRKHRFWVRKIFLKRQKLGAFHTYAVLMLRNLTPASAADKFNFSPIFFPAVSMYEINDFPVFFTDFTHNLVLLSFTDKNKITHKNCCD